MDCQILSDGVTVWVNDGNGYCIGRFGRYGIDIHHKAKDNNGNECLLCTHVATTNKDWESFQIHMKLFHNVQIADDYIPDRFRKGNS